MSQISEKAFEAFMLAMHENGVTGLGMRKNLEAYEAAHAPVADHWRRCEHGVVVCLQCESAKKES